jgi:hemerythrin superfamily protein
MAKSQPGRSDGLPLALEMLTSDHRKVEHLFEKFEEMKEEDDASRVAIAQRICSELTVHMQIEEDLVYPWLRENLDDTGMVAEAYVEHASGKQLIAEIMQVGEPDEEYDAKVKVLSEYIKHHVREEEGEIFPEVAGEEEELDELGQEMFARKAELMAEMGMDDEMPEEMPGEAEARKQRTQGQRAERGSR